MLFVIDVALFLVNWIIWLLIVLGVHRSHARVASSASPHHSRCLLLQRTKYIGIMHILWPCASVGIWNHQELDPIASLRSLSNRNCVQRGRASLNRCGQACGLGDAGSSVEAPPLASQQEHIDAEKTATQAKIAGCCSHPADLSPSARVQILRTLSEYQAVRVRKCPSVWIQGTMLSA